MIYKAILSRFIGKLLNFANNLIHRDNYNAQCRTTKKRFHRFWNHDRDRFRIAQIPSIRARASELNNNCVVFWAILSQPRQWSIVKCRFIVWQKTSSDYCSFSTALDKGTLLNKRTKCAWPRASVVFKLAK